FLKEQVKQPFNIEQGPLTRIQVFFRKDQDAVLLITIHHIVSDGTSVVLLIESLLKTYKQIAAGTVPSQNRDISSYEEFVLWEQAMLESSKGKRHADYWKEQLGGELPILEVLPDFPRPSTQSLHGKTLTKKLPKKLAQWIVSFSQTQKLQPSILFLGFFQILLHKYTPEEDIIIGMPVSGRPLKKFESVMGYCINMIGIRGRVTPETRLLEFFKQLQLTQADALYHSEYPFLRVVQDLKIQRNSNISPIFQISYAYQNFIEESVIDALVSFTKEKFPLKTIKGIYQEDNFDLGLDVFEEKENFQFHLKYNPDLYREESVERMLECYCNLMETVSENQQLCIKDYGLLSEKERLQILYEFNDTKVVYPKDKCIHELFEIQASKTPNGVAVLFEDRQLTYKELNTKSTQLAKYLQTLGVIPDTLVAICMERSIEMITALLGILKAGGVYVPLGPDYPDERLNYLLEDSQAAILLTQENLSGKVTNLIAKNIKKKNITTIYLDRDWKSIEKSVKTKKRLERKVNVGHLAYVIYTSGSTGRPKGVFISHASIANHCQAIQKYYGLTPDDSILQFASLNVDASLEQILPGLTKGAALILRDKDVWFPEEFRKRVCGYEISVVDIPPAYLHELLLASINNSIPATKTMDNGRWGQLRLVITGGEALSPETVGLWRSSQMKSIRLINAYGLTETTITSTAFEITEETDISAYSQNVPIGRPLDNETVCILDGNGHPVPIGVPGELHIGGVGVALGYLNRPELTQEKFIDDPHKPGTGMYKTGDLARWLAGGNIEFLGRIDHQVKIRGFRVELEEIEVRLREQQGVKEGVVVVQEDDNGEKQLVAYVVAYDDTLSRESLKCYLQKRLPGYMLPSVYVIVDTLPQTPGGKIDR
ncbi:MAG: amino acid adenylation domain-containing protein, partial [Planctomycetes bacterium]|nr:amino acid adenylation domain-containing protein [Planctomycetota bacterium]